MKMPSAPKQRGCGVYIFDDVGRILLAQRGPKARGEQFKWEGPGGSVEAGETYEAAAHREIMEELGVVLVIEDTLLEYDEIADGSGTVWEAKVFKARINGIPSIQEPDKCIGFGWFDLEEAKQLNLARHSRIDFDRLGW